MGSGAKVGRDWVESDRATKRWIKNSKIIESENFYRIDSSNFRQCVGRCTIGTNLSACTSFAHLYLHSQPALLTSILNWQWSQKPKQLAVLLLVALHRKIFAFIGAYRIRFEHLFKKFRLTFSFFKDIKLVHVVGVYLRHNQIQCVSKKCYVA